jgi:hypothetical protein
VGDLPLQHGVGLEPDRVAEAFFLQQPQQLRQGKRGIAAAVGLVDPLPGEIDPVLEVLLAGECFRLEACHLPGGSRCVVLGPATHHGPQRGIEAEALGVLDVFIACQPAVDRLPQQGEQAVLGVLPGAGVVHAARCGAGQAEGVVEFPVGEESGVTGDGGAVGLPLDWAVEIDP